MKIKSVIAIFFLMLLGLSMTNKVIADTQEDAEIALETAADESLAADVESEEEDDDDESWLEDDDDDDESWLEEEDDDDE